MPTYEHLQGVHMNDTDQKVLLPVRLILGGSDMSRIKTSEPARIGNDEIHVVQMITLGWTIISPGREMNRQWRSHDMVMQMQIFQCLTTIYGMNNDDLNLRSMTKLSGGLPYCEPPPKTSTYTFAACTCWGCRPYRG